jgi:hypothetical protein
VGHHVVGYLVSLAVGYWVFTLAEKEKGFSKTLGKIVAWTILVVSLLGPLCIAGKAVFCYSHLGSCPTSASCPWGNMPMGGWRSHCMEGKEGSMGMDCPEMSGNKKPEGTMMMKHHGMMDGAKDKDDAASKDNAK